MRVFCCQYNTVWEDKAANFRQVEDLLDSGQISPGSLIILPEMFATGFSMNSRSLAEPLNNSPTLDFLSSLSRKYQSHILAGMDVVENQTFTNDAVLISPDGQLAGRYSKIQPFTFAGEDKAISPGQHVVTFPISHWSLSPFICYDLRFPELFRLAAPSAELMVVIANWPTARVEQKIALLRARAIENQAYLIGVNRTGSDPNVDYPGRSIIIDPQGEIIAEAGPEPQLLSAELNLATVRDWRQQFPALRNKKEPGTLSLRTAP